MIIQIEPWIDDEEMNELRRVVESTFVTEGIITKEFEDKIKSLTGSKHAVAMTNGTVALYVSLKSLGIGHGDEVIVPDMTFIATANAVIMAGGTPIFCEVDPETYCIDVIAAKTLVTKKTRAIMPVHLYGQAADMTAVMNFATEFNLYVIEDAAQGVGVKFSGQHVGTFGNLGVLSFYGNKTITCGEGGIILTNNDELALACYRLKNHGRERKGIFIHEEIGFNFAFTEMQAAVGVAQLGKLKRIIERKKEIHDIYVSELNGLTELSPCRIDSRVDPVFWFTSFETDSLEKLTDYLLHEGIQTRRFFYPLHLQPCYGKNIEISNLNSRSFPISEAIYKKGISLPSAYHLTNRDQEFVINKIKHFYS